MKKIFSSLHARTFCHATEDLDRVRSALENTIGQSEITTSRVEGHHGNPIAILETRIEDSKRISGFFSKLDIQDLEELAASATERIDEGCNLFIRIDKQLAYKGTIKLSMGDDVVSIRIRMKVYPSKCEVASAAIKEFLVEEIAGREHNVRAS